MDILKIAAFSDGKTGGNPAGVAIVDDLPVDTTMQRIAAEVGFSETASGPMVAALKSFRAKTWECAVCCA